MLAGLLNLAYGLLLVAVSPAILYGMIARGKYRTGWTQKLFGRLPKRSSARPCMWFHAVSVGEVLQLRSIIASLKAEQPHVEIVVTTTTTTGLTVARQKFQDDCVCYFPLDFSWAVREALDRIRPTALVLVELELWPNLILETSRRRIALVLINGRISDRSYRGYRRIRPLMRRLLAGFRVIAVQSRAYQDRLVELGAPAERIAVTGSIKFDGVESCRDNPATVALRQIFKIREDARVFIAGSTQAPEEEFALDAYQTLLRDFPDLRLILVPRHKERFDEVGRLVIDRGLPLLRRSEASSDRACDASTGSWRGRTAGGVEVTLQKNAARVPAIRLLDTLGELSACWGLADVAFVGGSLTNRGGQNMIEPAAYGAALLFGPNTHNFRDVVEQLLNEHAALVVHDQHDLAEKLRCLLADENRLRAQGAVAQRLVLGQQGAAARTVDLLQSVLPTSCSGEDTPEAHAA